MPESVTSAAADVKFIEANGLRFAYLEEGRGPLVLMVHGFPDTAHTWDEVRPAIAALGYRVVTPFTRGYGPTAIPSPPAYDSDTLGRDLLGLIAAFGETSAILVGHDWGAGACFSACGLMPERVRKLITVAIPHPASVVPTLSLAWAVRHFLTFQLPGTASRLRANDFKLIDGLVARWSPGWAVPPGETDAVKRSLREPGRAEAAIAYYRALRPRLPRSQRIPVTVPAVAFAGSEDVIAPTLYERARVRYRAGYEIVVMPGGHFMHRQYPARFIAELSRVLGRPQTAG